MSTKAFKNFLSKFGLQSKFVRKFCSFFPPPPPPTGKKVWNGALFIVHMFQWFHTLLTSSGDNLKQASDVITHAQKIMGTGSGVIIGPPHEFAHPSRWYQREIRS
jgi:hypothetical protein